MHSNLKTLSFENLISYWKTLSKQIRTEGDDDELTIISTESTSPLFNPVFVKDTARCINPFHSSYPHSIWLNNLNDKSIDISALQGDILMDKVPVMIKALEEEETVNLPENVEIRLLKNNSDLSEWIKPVAFCFELDEKNEIAYRSCLEQHPDSFAHFVAYEKDSVIGAGTIFLHPLLAGFYNLAVLPEYRRQGIGAAIHRTRFNYARSLGYTHGTLQATPMAARLDESLGFQTCSELTIYSKGEF